MDSDDVYGDAPRGAWPELWAQKLCYFVSKINKIQDAKKKYRKSLILQNIIFYVQAFTKIADTSHFKQLSREFEGQQRSFNFKKMPAMFAVAINFDKYILNPILLITAIASGKALFDAVGQEYENFYTDPGSIVDANCQLCGEVWMGGYPLNASKGPKINVNNITLYFETYTNIPPCGLALDSVQNYVDISLHNAANFQIPHEHNIFVISNQLREASSTFFIVLILCGASQNGSTPINACRPISQAFFPIMLSQ